MVGIGIILLQKGDIWLCGTYAMGQTPNIYFNQNNQLTSIEMPTSIPEMMFSNPNTGSFNVHFSENMTVQINVFDITGRLIIIHLY
jgi:hypothetical protein